MALQPMDVLSVWFSAEARARWFDPDPAFDDALRGRFSMAIEQARRGGLDHWLGTPTGALALVIVLDQLPRNIYRETPAAYATDALARRIAVTAVERGFDLALPIDRRAFLYMPLMHSEAKGDQRRCVKLVEERIGPGDTLDHAREHLAVIERFGRFPHRNAILGRASRAEEEAFLAESGASA